MELSEEQFDFDGDGPVLIQLNNDKFFKAYASNDITGIYLRRVDDIHRLYFYPWHMIQNISCESPIQLNEEGE